MRGNRSWLYLAVLTLVVALTWTATSAIGYFRRSTVPQDVEKAAAPLDPDLDTTLFTKLQQRAGAQ